MKPSPLVTRWLTIFASALILGLALPIAKAEQAQDVGNYVVHFNALPTSFLTAKIATEFRVLRSKNRAFLSISVLKKHTDGSNQPVSARVLANTVNLTGQAREIKMREVHQGESIYQLGDFKIHNEETLDFTLEVTPLDTDQTYNVKFRQQFFID